MPAKKPNTSIRNRTVYSDADKARCLVYLDLCENNYDQAATELGIPRNTLWEWNQGNKQSHDVPRLRTKGRAALAGIFEEIAFQSLGLVPDKLDKCGAESLVRIAKMATENMLLLRGQPTEIVEQRMPQEEALARVSALVEAARAQALAGAAGTDPSTDEGIVTIEGEVREVDGE